MSILDTNIDALIQAEQAKLEELLKVKEEQQKKLAALKLVADEFAVITAKYSITENEYYQSIASDIEEWIKNSPEAAIHASLTRHFGKAAAKAEKVAFKADSQVKVSTLPKPTLKVGSYRNPATQEVVEKIKRNPRQLDQWVAEYGFAIVRTWKE